MIKINFDKYGKIRNLDFGEEVIFKGNNRVNQIFVAFDDVSYNPNHYMTYSALINENDYEGNLTDLATAKTTIDGVEGYTFYLFSNLTAKAGELKLSVRLVDRTSERVLVSGIIPLVIEDTAISTYASVDITKTQYNALLTAFDELSQSIDATNFKTINGESIYGEGDIVVLTGDVMVDYVGQEISNVNDSLWNLSQRISDVENENAELNALIEKQDKKIKQLELASEGNILSTITESDSAYEVGVGVDTLPYATIDKIGGMTYKSENLLDDNLLKASDGTFTKQSDNSYISKALGSYGSAYFNSVWNSSLSSMVSTNGISLSKGTYYISFKAKLNSGTSASGVGVSINLSNTKKVDATAVENPTLSSSYQNYVRTITLTADDKIGISFLVGGNASSAVIQIKDIMISRINTTYQPYFEGLRDSKVTEIISEGYSNNAKLKVNDTIRFIRFTNLNYASNNVQLLQAKGKKTDGVYTMILNGGNKRIGVFKRYDFNYNDTYLLMTSTTSVYDLVETFGEELIITSLTNEAAVNSVLVNAYKLIQKIAIPTAIQNLDGYGQSNFEDNNEYNYIDFENKKFIRYGYYEGETWKSSYLETDIAEFLQDNVIEVESGGTITFENEYKQDVPFTWTFQEKL